MNNEDQEDGKKNKIRENPVEEEVFDDINGSRSNPRPRSSSQQRQPPKEKGVRRNLAAELDAIDAEFEKESREHNKQEVSAPDGIRITVNVDEDREFQEEEQLDYLDDEEVVVPINEDEDAEMVAGEEPLNTSLSSSAIISFNPQKTLGDLEGEFINENLIQPVAKLVLEMTPDELVEANPALKRWMEKMMASKKDNKTRTEQPLQKTKERMVVVKNSTKGNGKETLDHAKIIKSPSDTTIYAPALKLTPNGMGIGVVGRFLLDGKSQGDSCNKEREMLPMHNC